MLVLPCPPGPALPVREPTAPWDPSSARGRRLTDGGRDGQVGDGGPENGHERALGDGYGRVLEEGGGRGVR